MDERQRDARLQTLRAELEVESKRRAAAEAEAVAARAACDELKLEIQRAGLEGPLKRQRVHRSGALLLTVLLVMVVAAATTVGIFYYRGIQRQAADTKALGEGRAREHRLSSLNTELSDSLAQCEARARRRRDSPVCPVCPVCPTTEAKTEEKAAANAVKASPRKRTPARPVVGERDGKPVPGGPDTSEEVASLVSQAQTSYSVGRFARALELARKAIALQPQQRDAVSVLGASACAMRDRETARYAYTRMMGFQRNVLMAICRNYGVMLP